MTHYQPLNSWTHPSTYWTLSYLAYNYQCKRLQNLHGQATMSPSFSATWSHIQWIYYNSLPLSPWLPTLKLQLVITQKFSACKNLKTKHLISCHQLLSIFPIRYSSFVFFQMSHICWLLFSLLAYLGLYFFSMHLKYSLSHSNRLNFLFPCCLSRPLIRQYHLSAFAKCHSGC